MKKFCFFFFIKNVAPGFFFHSAPQGKYSDSAPVNSHIQLQQEYIVMHWVIHRMFV